MVRHNCGYQDGAQGQESASEARTECPDPSLPPQSKDRHVIKMMLAEPNQCPKGFHIHLINSQR